MIKAALAAGLLALAPAGEPTVAFTIRAPAITEASGLAYSVASDVFYVQNDSGDSARFFALDARTGRLRTTFRVPGAVNHDWEDLAVARDAAGVPSVWLADIGDNDATRREVQIYRVRERAASYGDITTSRPAVWRLRYPTGPVDAESLFVDPHGRAYVVTKTTTGVSTVYAVPLTADRHRVQVMRRIGTMVLHGGRRLLHGLPVEATGAAMSPDGTVLAVRTYLAVYLWHVRDGDVAAALRTRPVRVPLPLQRQGEGICFAYGNSVFVDSEGRDQPVWRIRLPRAFRPPEPLGSPGHRLRSSSAAPASSAAPTSATRRSASHSAGYLATAGVFVLLLLAVFATFRRSRRG